MTAIVVRWCRFSFVGAFGVGVQLGTLALLVSGLGVHYLPATALAVETAVLHNFVWHERYTWRERGSRRARQALWRLLRFHLGNGAVSLAGSLLLMPVLVEGAHLPYLMANAATIAACGLFNFAIGEWLVFR